MALRRENVIRTAEKHVAKGKLEAAIKEYRKVLKEYPNDANTLNRVGDLYARIERFDEAVKLFSQIAEQYTQDGFVVKAIAIYKKIIKLDPMVLPVYEKLAELYHKQGLLNDARSQYQVLADYYERHDNPASAITVYQRMADIEPSNPGHHLKLAELFESQHLNDRAVKQYRILADLLLAAGSAEESSLVLQKAIEINPQDLSLIRSLLEELESAGHGKVARNLVQRVSGLNPEIATLAERAFASAEVVEPSSVAGPAPEFAAPVSDGNSPGDQSFAAPAPADLDDSMGQGEVAQLHEDASVFELDLDDDRIASTQVTPPPELLAELAAQETAGEKFESSSEEEEFEFVIEDFDQGLDEVTVAPLDHLDDTASGGVEPEPSFDLDLAVPEEEAVDISPPVAEAEIKPLEIDWSVDLDDLAAELPVLAARETQAEPTGPDALGGPAEAKTAVAAEGVKEALESAAADVQIDSAVEIVPPNAADGPTPPSEIFDVEFDMVGSSEESIVDAISQSLAGNQEPGVTPHEPVSEAVEPAAVKPAAVKPLPMLAPDAAILPPVSQVLEPGLISGRRVVDLLAEAKVFYKYGLQEKSEDRLAELFGIDPAHLEGLCLQTELHIAAGRHREALDRANQVAGLAAERGAHGPWLSLRDKLIEQGFKVTGDRVLAKPKPRDAKGDRIAQLLEDLNLDMPSGTYPIIKAPIRDASPEAASRPEDPQLPAPPAADQPVIGDPTVAASTSPGGTLPPDDSAIPAEVEASTSTQAAESAPVSDAAKKEGDKQLFSLADELDLDDLDDLDDTLDQMIVSPGPESESGSKLQVDPLDESSLGWLEGRPDAPPAAVEESAIFEDEDDFFDLAAELEKELSAEEGAIESTAYQNKEPSLQEIIEGFKKGVAENLSEEDYDTHFNLGIAYREMGLLDEAIGEFQLSSKDARYLVESSSMLGICFTEKGLSDLALKWYRKGLAAADIGPEQTQGLLYELGTTYVGLGDNEAAYKTFVEIHALNDSYRDVAERIESLSQEIQS